MNEQTVEFGYEVGEEERMRLEACAGVQQAVRVGNIINLYYKHPPAKHEKNALDKALRTSGGRVVAEI